MEQFPIPAPAFDGNSRVVEAGNAFEWLRQGWAMFVAYPGQWIALTIVLFAIMLGLLIVPLVGPLAANLLSPLLGGGMLYACQKASKGQAPEIPDLFVAFTRNATPMLLVGVLYMAGIMIIGMIGFVLGGGSLIGGLGSGSPVGIGLAFGGLMFALLLSLALSVPLAMAIWFAPALVLFNNMQPVEALKASFNACAKNALPFLVYGLILLVLCFFAALPVGLGFLVLVPVIAGSIFASYRDIFVGS